MVTKMIKPDRGNHGNEAQPQAHHGAIPVRFKKLKSNSNISVHILKQAQNFADRCKQSLL